MKRKIFYDRTRNRVIGGYNVQMYTYATTMLTINGQFSNTCLVEWNYKIKINIDITQVITILRKLKNVWVKLEKSENI